MDHIVFVGGPKFRALLRKNPLAFTLLSVIADLMNDLDSKEVLIGKYLDYGMSRQEYRTALEVLSNYSLINQQTTNKGTRVKIIDSTIFKIITITANHKVTNQQPTSHQQELIPNHRSQGTLEEILAYCLTNGLSRADGEYCFHHWQGNGWMNGKNPIKDWRMTVSAWKAAGHLPSQKNNGPPKGPNVPLS